MPTYEVQVEIPKETPKDSPKETTLTVEGDLLTELLVKGRPGNLGYAGVRLQFGQAPLIPDSLDQWLHSWGERKKGRCRFKIPGGRTDLKLLAYNESTNHDHRFDVTVQTKLKKEVPPYSTIISLLDKIRRALLKILGA